MSGGSGKQRPADGRAGLEPPPGAAPGAAEPSPGNCGTRKAAPSAESEVQASSRTRWHPRCDVWEQGVLWRARLPAGAGLPLLAARTPPSLINSHFPSLEPPGGAISLYLKQRQASYLIYRLQGRVAPGWLLGYLLNGNQGGEIAHRSCQPSAKCCCFCLEQLEEAPAGPGWGRRGRLWSHPQVEE